MEIRMEMDEGFNVGWGWIEPEEYEDEDVIHFERNKSRVVYNKGKRTQG